MIKKLSLIILCFASFSQASDLKKQAEEQKAYAEVLFHPIMNEGLGAEYDNADTLVVVTFDPEKKRTLETINYCAPLFLKYDRGHWTGLVRDFLPIQRKDILFKEYGYYFGGCFKSNMYYQSSFSDSERAQVNALINLCYHQMWKKNTIADRIKANFRYNVYQTDPKAVATMAIINGKAIPLDIAAAKTDSYKITLKESYILYPDKGNTSLCCRREKQ